MVHKKSSGKNENKTGLYLYISIKESKIVGNKCKNATDTVKG